MCSCACFCRCTAFWVWMLNFSVLFVPHTKTCQLCIHCPMASPIPLAIAYPKLPVSMAGWIMSCQPLEVAMAAAVAGPPTLALDAMSTAFMGSRSSLPPARQIPRWMLQAGGGDQRAT